jgi:hypothetical protein
MKLWINYKKTIKLSAMEKFFSLEWFKERIESSVDRALDARINAQLDQVFGYDSHEPVPLVKESPTSSIKLVNDLLTVVFRDGTIVSKPNATEQHFERVKVAKSKEEILNVIHDKTVAEEGQEAKKEAERLTNMAKGYELLGKLKDFRLEGNTVYLAVTNRSIPELLAEQFTNVVGRYSSIQDITELESKLEHDDEYQGLKNFFMWCCLNPRAEVADQLYNFLQRNSFRITKQGFFVALRNVVTVGAEDKSLLDFVSNANNKVKAVWKQNPDGFNVVKHKDGSYTLSKLKDTPRSGEIVGKLSDLYKDLPNMSSNRFTDAHTHTFDIRVGRVVNMPMEQCNWSTADCAHAGLHFTADQIHYVGCGDTSVLTLINPMKVVGIGEYKGRCYEYLPIMTVPRVEATKILHDISFDTLELDEDYAIHELNNLAEVAKAGFTAETSKYSFNLPSMSTDEINSIVQSLESMKNIIDKRVSIIE